MARNRSEFSALTRRGPHKVLRGDLGFAGIPGVLYTPASGFGLPGVAFGHRQDDENPRAITKPLVRPRPGGRPHRGGAHDEAVAGC